MPNESEEQGPLDNAGEPSFFIIGRILKPHGIRGEVRVEVHTDLPERFSWLKEVHLSRDPNDIAPEVVSVESVRYHKGYVLLKLKGYEGRDDVELLRSIWVLVPEADVIPLEEGEVYLYQLEGLAVYTDEGEHLGEVQEIIETGANEVFVVQGARGEVLIPNMEEVVLDVDVEEGRMTVHLIEGLLP